MPVYYSSDDKRTTLFCLGAILIVVFLAFSACLTNGFVNRGDDAYLLDNSQVRSLSAANLAAIFTTTVNRVYLPLTTLSFALEYRFFGYTPVVYHITNIALHLAVTALVFIFCLQLGLSLRGACIAALVFGLHPMHVEPVAWVSGRAHLLSAFFSLAAICTYMRYLRTYRIPLYAATVALSALGVLAAPLAASLPLVFLLLDWLSNREPARRIIIEKIPHIIIAGIIGWITYALHIRPPMYTAVNAALVWVWSFIFYPRSFLFPYVLVPLYRAPVPVAVTVLPYAASAGAFAGLLIVLYRFRQNRWLLFSAMLYTVSIFFLLPFDTGADGHIVTDAFMYLPSVGICALIGLSAENVIRRCIASVGVMRRLFPGLIILAVASFYAITFVQCGIWRNSETLWRHQLHFYPKTPVALAGLGAFYRTQDTYQGAVLHLQDAQARGAHDAPDFDREAFAEAIEPLTEVMALYRRAIELDPSYARAYRGLADILYRDINNYQYARALYIRALEYDPQCLDTHRALGSLYIDLDMPSDAVRVLERMRAIAPENIDILTGSIILYTQALEQGPEQAYEQARIRTMRAFESIVKQKPSAQAYFTIGVMYDTMGGRQASMIAFERALQLKPRYPQALHRLGNSYLKIGNSAKAIEFYHKALAIDPRYEDAYFDMGAAYAALGDYGKAIDAYRDVLTRNPRHADAYFNLGHVYLAMGRNAQAIDSYQQAIAINPRHAEAHHGLGTVYGLLRLYGRAEGHYREAIDINPRHVNALVNLSTVYVHMRDFEKAHAYVKKAQELGHRPDPEYMRFLELRVVK